MECKVGIISNYGTGGSAVYLQQFAEAFEGQAFPVKFYFPANPIVRIKKEMYAENSLVEPASSPNIFRYFKPLKYMFHLARYLYNACSILLDDDCKVAHLLFPFYLSDTVTMKRLKKRGLKIVLTIHEVLPHQQYLGGWLDMRLLHSLYSHADILVVHSKVLKEKLGSLFTIEAKRIRVIHHGSFRVKKSRGEAKEIRGRYGIPEGKKILFFFGNIRENKGLAFLLHAYKSLNESFFLVIAGSSGMASEPANKVYEDLITRHGLCNRIVWINRFIPDDEIPDLFEIADTVILPYTRSFHAQSGVLNLAIGYEKPVVVCDVGGLGEVVRDYNLGVVVEPENAIAINEGIIRLFFQHEKSYGFARYQEEANWNKIADQYIEIYKELI